MKVKELEFGHPSQRDKIRGKHGIHAGRAIVLSESLQDGAALSICIDLVRNGKVPGALKDAFAKEVKNRVATFSKDHPDYTFSRAGRKEASNTKKAAPKGKNPTVKKGKAKKKAA